MLIYLSHSRDAISAATNGEKMGLCWAIAVCALVASLAAAGPQSSAFVARAVGICIAVCLAVPFLDLFRRPDWAAHPIIIFSAGSLYFFAMDMAVLRRVGDYSAHVIVAAELVVALFLAVTFGTWSLSHVRPRFLLESFACMDGNLGATSYFWSALFVFGLEYLRRFYLDGFSVSGLLDDLFLARAGGAFRREVLGDSTVWMEPAQLLFPLVPLLADRAWKRGAGALQMAVLLPVVALCLITLVLDGVRGNLLFAILLPMLVRAAQRDHATGKILVAMLFGSFLLAPLLDSMYKVRAYGWENVWRVDGVSWNMMSAHRDDNFHFVVNLVDILEHQDGIVLHQGPLGFLRGTAKFGSLALASAIPRAIWASKPSPFDLVGAGREWYESGSVVADLLDGGGITFVIFGGICFGLWIRLLESVFEITRGDGAALVYCMLLAITLSLLRSLFPWNTVPLILGTVGLVLTWRVLGALQLMRAPS
jgi:hypothetical protein